MTQALVEALSDAQRIALAYSPAGVRPLASVLFAFDNRLGQALRAASEPIMAQMRLAWWRDQLRLTPAAREDSDAVAAGLSLFAGEEAALLAMVDGWEELLSEQFDHGTIARIVAGRGEGFGALARLVGHANLAHQTARQGQAYALADVAANLGDEDERGSVLSFAERGQFEGQRLPRALRSVAVLGGLAKRSLAQGGAPLLYGPASALAAIRLGLVGR